MEVAGVLLSSIPLSTGGNLFKISVANDVHVNIISTQNLQIHQDTPYLFTNLLCKSVIHNDRKQSLFLFDHKSSTLDVCERGKSCNVPNKFKCALPHAIHRIAINQIGNVVDGMVLVNERDWMPSYAGREGFLGHVVPWNASVQLLVPCAFCSSMERDNCVADWMIRQHAKSCLMETIGSGSIGLLKARETRSNFDLIDVLFNDGDECKCLRQLSSYTKLAVDESVSMWFLDRNRMAITDRGSFPMAIPNITHECVAMVREAAFTKGLLVSDNVEIVLQFDRQLLFDHFADCVQISSLPEDVVYDTIINVRGMAGWINNSAGRKAVQLVDCLNRCDEITFYLDAIQKDPLTGMLCLDQRLSVVSELHISEAVLRKTRDGGIVLLSMANRTRIGIESKRSSIGVKNSRDCYYLDELSTFNHVKNAIKVRIMILKVNSQVGDWRRVVQVCDARSSMRMVVEGRELVERFLRPLAGWMCVECSVLDGKTLFLHSIDTFNVAKHSMILLDILESREK